MADSTIHDWYLAEWLEAAGFKQADLVRAFGWSKAKASDVVAGNQRYNRDLVNQVANFLEVRPYELLMHPDLAKAMRGLRDTAAEIVKGVDFGKQPPVQGKRSLFRSVEPEIEPEVDHLGASRDRSAEEAKAAGIERIHSQPKTTTRKTPARSDKADRSE